MQIASYLPTCCQVAARAVFAEIALVPVDRRMARLAIEAGGIATLPPRYLFEDLMIHANGASNSVLMLDMATRAFRNFCVKRRRRFHQQFGCRSVARNAALCLHTAIGGVTTFAFVLEEGMGLRKRSWPDRRHPLRRRGAV